MAVQRICELAIFALIIAEPPLTTSRKEATLCVFEAGCKVPPSFLTEEGTDAVRVSLPLSGLRLFIC